MIKLHKQRFYALLQIATKFVIILESPEMLSSLTPAVSTHEKFAFGHQSTSKNALDDDTSSIHSLATTATANTDNQPPIQQRQVSKHIMWAPDVVGGSSGSIHFSDTGSERDENENRRPKSPLPSGKLLNKNGINAANDDA
eukprot:182383_1